MMETEYLISEAAAFRLVDGQVLIVNVPGQKLIVLNRAASVLWQRLDEAGRATEAALAKILEEECGAPPERSRADARAFLSEMRSRSLFVEREHKEA